MSRPPLAAAVWAALALWPVLTASACDAGGSGRRAVPAARAATPEQAATSTSTAETDEQETLQYLVRSTPYEADPPPDTTPLPLIVALHGRGSRPETFADTFADFPTPARVLLVEAPIDEGNGRAWFSFRGKTRDGLATEMRGLAAAVVDTTDAFVDTHATRGKPVVMGFSQGAMLVYILALEHGDRFRAAMPVSGALFDSFLPPPGRRLEDLPPLTVLHGEDDPVIPARYGLEKVPILEAQGAPVSVATFPDVPHWIMKGMRTALYEALSEAVGDD